MSDTFEEVKSVIVELLGVDEAKVTPEAKFREDLEADSLDLVELIMAFEEKFGGEISDEDAQKITTVGEAVAYIEEHMKITSGGAQFSLSMRRPGLRSKPGRSLCRGQLRHKDSLPIGPGAHQDLLLAARP